MGDPPEPTQIPVTRDYSNRQLVRRLLALAWQFRCDCLISLILSISLLLLGLAGLQLLGVGIDVIRHALDPSQRPPLYPFGWKAPPGMSPLQIVAPLSLAIVAPPILRAVRTDQYNMGTRRRTQ